VTLTATVQRRSVPGVGQVGPQDAVLVARLQAGDDLALAVVYELHAPVVYGLARRVTRDEQLARDITQDVFTFLWEQPGRVDLSRGSLRAYLAVLTHRRAVDEVRKTERRGRIEALLALPDADEGPEHQVVEAAAQSWRLRRLRVALEKLPEDQRRAINLAYFDGLTYKQVAAAMGIPEGTAKSRMRLALTRLRHLLEEDVRTVI